MFGRSCLAIAARVADGSAFLPLNSTASPDFAAQAAAGIANRGSSAGATITFGDGSPVARVRNSSMAAASRNLSLPWIGTGAQVAGCGGVTDLESLGAPR